MRELRGSDLVMIFQDPLTSLNPTFTGRDADGRRRRRPPRPAGERAARRCDSGRSSCSSRSASPTSAERLDDYPHQFSGGHAAADHDRDGAHARAGAAHRRRADVGARRDARGADRRAAEAAARDARDRDHLHLARPRRGLADLRSRGRHVRRARGRGGRRGVDLRAPAPPVHAGAARCDPVAPAPGRAARHDPRARAEPLGAAAGLQVRRALPARPQRRVNRARARAEVAVDGGQVRCFIYDPSSGYERRVPRGAIRGRRRSRERRLRRRRARRRSTDVRTYFDVPHGVTDGCGARRRASCARSTASTSRSVAARSSGSSASPAPARRRSGARSSARPGDERAGRVRRAGRHAPAARATCAGSGGACR